MHSVSSAEVHLCGTIIAMEITVVQVDFMVFQLIPAFLRETPWLQSSLITIWYAKLPFRAMLLTVSVFTALITREAFHIHISLILQQLWFRSSRIPRVSSKVQQNRLSQTINRPSWSTPYEWWNSDFLQSHSDAPRSEGQWRWCYKNKFAPRIGTSLP